MSAGGEQNMSKYVDEVEKTVYSHLKPLGFKKYGRTLQRIVSDDIPQVINFQISAGFNEFCVNLGIRVPECAARLYDEPQEIKKYYREYECCIRTRLGAKKNRDGTWFKASDDAEKTAELIIRELDKTMIPMFDAMSSREGILAKRRDYPFIDGNDGLILLDECMIHLHMGDAALAKAKFDEYYALSLKEYERSMQKGRKVFLKKGERVVCGSQDITAVKDGYVTLYNANRSHLDYLDKLAVRLGFCD